MCIYLTKKNSTPKTARKDIVCYKILENINTWNGRKYGYTPFMGCSVDLGETYEALGDLQVKSFDFKTWFETPFGCYETWVGEGAIHTFKTLDGAKKMFTNHRLRHLYGINRSCVIVKCIIPKGTKYFSGVFEDTRIPSYASTELTYTEEIVFTEPD